MTRLLLFIARQVTQCCAVLMAAGMFFSLDVAAEIYKCTNATGKVDYTDKPCKGESSIFTPKAAPKIDEGVAERREKTQRLLQAYEEEQVIEERQAAEIKATKAQREEECRRARIYYRRIQDAGRVLRTDSAGNRVDYTSQEREDATATAKTEVEKWCD